MYSTLALKKVHNKIYVHRKYIDDLDAKEKTQIQNIMKQLPDNFSWNIVRIDFLANNIGFLNYPNFESEPHPSLIESITVNLNNLKKKYYQASETNPPILHRKETFLDSKDKNYKIFQKLTEEEEKMGLLDRSMQHKIGHKRQWEELVKQKGLRIVNHRLQQLG